MRAAQPDDRRFAVIAGAVVAAVVAGSLLLALAVIRWHAMRSVDDAAARRLMAEARQIATAIALAWADHADPSRLQALLRQLRDQGHLTQALLVDQQDRVIADASGSAPGQPAPLLAATPSQVRTAAQEPQLERPFAPGEDVRRAYVRIGDDPRLPVLCLDAADAVPALRDDLRSSLAAAVALAVLIAVGAGSGTCVALVSRAAAAARLGRAERLSAAGAVAASIAHEVRNPLGHMLASAEVIAASPNAGEDERRLATAIADEIDRIDEHLDGFLDLVRDQPLRVEPLDLGALVRETADRLSRHARGLAIALETRLDDAAVVSGDRRRLRQVVLNLLLNACDAAGSGGRVAVVVERDGSAVRLVVDDSGPGIPPVMRTAVFDPFVTTKAHGTGLGLSGSRRIVERHGGTITIAQARLGGARLLVRLPAVGETSCAS